MICIKSCMMRLIEKSVCHDKGATRREKIQADTRTRSRGLARRRNAGCEPGKKVIHPKTATLGSLLCDDIPMIKSEKDIPNVIWLQWADDDGELLHPDEQTWCKDKIYGTDIRYVREADPEFELRRKQRRNKGLI